MILSEMNIPVKTVNALGKKKINTVNDLVMYFPRKYLDYRKIVPLMEAVDRDCAISGYLESYEKQTDKNMTIIKAHLIEESSGQKVTITWIGQSYQYNAIKNFARKEIVVCGKVKHHIVYGYTVTNPYAYYLKEYYTGKIVPVYTKIKGVTDEMLKKQISRCLFEITDPLDPKVVEMTKLPDYLSALNAIHSPQDTESIKKAEKRMIFNDMLYYTTKLKLNAALLPTETDVKTEKHDMTEQMIKGLPYELTDDQRKAYLSIRERMELGKRVNLLVQGDVSCGKTTVAFAAMVLMADNGYQSALMAPTTVLAKQHYEGLKEIADKFGIRIACVTSELKGKAKTAILKEIETGEITFVVGTQSLFSEKLNYSRLGLVITDEEHRFGVKQRESLEKKALSGVHVITMSATPLPRSVADAVYGENKEIVNIMSMPSGRKQVQTAINNSENKIMEFIEKQLKDGRQAYVVCPLINKADEESVTGDLESVEEAEIRYKEYFMPKGYKVGVITGQTSAEDTEMILNDFRENRYQILVSTTVIEVGVNVPNANVMVINNAERFGLAQLHQLRGRVCRGQWYPYCILKSREKENPRLQTMVQTTNGFEIAKADIEQRGIGDLLGVAQSGSSHYMDQILAMPNLYGSVKKYAQLLIDNHMEDPLIELYEK